MKNKGLLLFIGLIALGAAVAFSVNFTSGLAAGKVNSKPLDMVDLASQDVKAKEGAPNMDSSLNSLVSLYKSEGAEAMREFAAIRKLPVEGNRVKVVLRTDKNLGGGPGLRGEARTAAVERVRLEVEKQVTVLGGEVERAFRTTVRCNIDISNLEQLAHLPNVRGVRMPIKLINHVVTEGVANTGASSYFDLNPYHNGGGASVCVLDSGFEHYQALQGTELPASVVAQSFTDDGGPEEGGVHGTACAEIIHDMAPDASLYLARILFLSDMPDAFDWISGLSVDVVSSSLGHYFGPGDGTGYESEMARSLQSRGTQYVTSAGNSGDDHYGGFFNDPDGDGWHNFNGTDEILHFYVPSIYGQYFGVYGILKWNDWGGWDPSTYSYGGATKDFDLHLFIWDSAASEWNEVDASTNAQPSFPWPYESTNSWYSTDDTYWGFAIRKYPGTVADSSTYFNLYAPTHYPQTLEYLVPANSVTMPADSPYILTVGATDAFNNELHYYSSQGPTNDGRMKPDMTAPSGVSSSDLTYGDVNSGGFYGTSASCPHVAGALALLKSKTPYTVAEIVQILYSRAVDMGDSGSDNVYGHGRLNLRQ